VSSDSKDKEREEKRRVKREKFSESERRGKPHGEGKNQKSKMLVRNRSPRRGQRKSEGKKSGRPGALKGKWKTIN